MAVLEEADRVYPNFPLQNLELCSLAVSLVEALDSEGPIRFPDLRFRAWKDLSTAYRWAGRLQQASETLDTASALAASCVEDDPEFCSAQVHFARSIILNEGEDSGGAMECLLAARGVFEQTDFHKFTQTYWQEAIIHFKRGDFEATQRAYEDVVTVVRSYGRTTMLADLYGNIARMYADFGRPWLACEFLARSIEINRSEGSRMSEMRNMWTLGRTLLTTGRLDEAINVLEDTITGYEALGEPRNAMKIELEIAQALLAADPDADLHERFRDLASRALIIGLPITAAHAAAQLRDIAARHRLNREVLEYTQSYLTESAIRPEMAYRPPIPTGLG